MLDRQLSLRIPIESLHAIERETEKANELRRTANEAGAGGLTRRMPLSVSEVARHLIELGLAVKRRDPEVVASFVNGTIESHVIAALASGYRDPNMARLLKKIAASVPVEPDFG